MVGIEKIKNQLRKMTEAEKDEWILARAMVLSKRET